MEEGQNQEDNAPDEVILDDSCEGDVLSHETPTDTTRVANIGTQASAQLEAAPGITEKTVVTHVVTISSQKETVSSKGCVINVHADIPAPPTGCCPSKDTSASECLRGEVVPDVTSAGCQLHHSTDLTTVACQPSLVEPIKAACISDGAFSQFVKTDPNIGKPDTHIDAAKNAEHTLAPGRSSKSRPVNSSIDRKPITYTSDDTLTRCGLVDESTSSDVQNDQLVIPVSSEVVIPVNSEVAFPASCKLVIPVSSKVVLPVSSEVVLPVSSKVVPPVSSEVVLPVSSEVVIPVSSEVVLPISSEVVLPVSSVVVLPVSSEVVLPVSSDLVLPVSSEVVLPISSEVVHPVSSEVVLPVSSEVVHPVSSEVVLPISSEVVIPISSEVVLPVSSEVIPPVSSEVVLLTSSKVVHPVSSEVVLPVSSEVVLPVSSEVVLPVTSEVVLPVSSEVVLPTNSEVVHPVSSEVVLPVSSEMVLPISSEVVIPISSEVVLPVSSKVIPPISSEVVLLASSEVVLPVSSEVVLPVSSEVVLPVSSEVVLPISSEVVLPVSSEVVLPVSSEVVLPVTSEVVLPKSSEVVLPVNSEVVPPVSSEVVIPDLALPVSSEVVIPVSSKEARSHQIPSDVIDEQLKVACTDTASYKCAKELFQGTQAPRYIIIRNTQNNKTKQEIIRKPGEKLTSLLERLTARKGGDVAVTLSKNKSVSATEAQTEVHQSSLSGSPAVSVVSMRCEPAFSQNTVKETSPSTSGKTTVTYSPVFHKLFPVLKLSSQTDSSTKTDQSQASLQSQSLEVPQFEKIGTPVKIPPGVDPAHLLPQLFYLAQARKSDPISTSSLPNKRTKVFTKSGEQEFTIFGPADDSKQLPNSVTPGLPADKIKCVLSCPPVQGSRTPNIVFAGPDRHGIVLRKAGKTCLQSDLQTSGAQNLTRQSKYPFSLLQSTAPRIPEAVQMNAGIQSGTMKPQTVRSLLSSYSKAVPILKSTKHSISETGSVNASTSLSGLTNTIILQGAVKPSVHVNTGRDEQTHIRQCQLTSTGQIIFQPVSQPIVAVTTSATLSKLAVAVLANSVPINKACIAPISSPTTSGRSVIVMPTAVLSTPVPTILTPSSVSSKSAVPAGTVTYNITATSNKSSDALKAAFVPKTPEANTTIQSSAHTVQNCSDLISRIALQSAPGTSATKPSTNVNSSMQALGIALLQQLRQGVPHLGEVAAPVRIIVSQGSSLQSAAKPVVTQPEPSVFTNCGTITTPTGKKITLSRTEQRSVTVTAGSKQIPKLIYPKPVSTEVLLVASSKSKSISLLPMSVVAKNQTTPEPSGAAVLTSSATKTNPIPLHQPADAKPKDDQVVEVADMKEKATNNTAANSYSKKVEVSTNVTAPRKSKNTVYTAILRTGQGPVSVRVVAPDLDDDSSDTMSDAGLSNVTLSEESLLTTEDTRGEARGSDSWPLNKLSDNLDYCEELPVFYQDSRDSCVRNDAVLNTGLKEIGAFMDSVVSEHHVQDVDGEETDTDTEVTTMEEQDMSVLRQLLTNNTDTKSPFDGETIQNIDHVAAYFDLVDSSNAGYQSHSAKADHEYMALTTSNSDHGSIDPIVTEQYSHVKSCDLKIESVFSLRDSGNFEDAELPADAHICQELPDHQPKLLPVFNVRTSDDWKSFLSPCFVVLERLPKSEFSGVGGSAKNASKCSGYCRKRTLDYLCNLNLLRCINHPDPFLLLTSKLKRRYVKKALKEMTKHEVITEMCAREGMSNASQMMKRVYVQEAASEPFVEVKAADLTKAVNKLSPIVKETCVKVDDNSPSVVKKTYAKKAIDKTVARVKVRPLKKPMTIFSLLTKKAYVKEPMGELHTKPACVKEIMSKSSPVVKGECGKDDLKLFQQAEAHVLGETSKPSPVIKETCVNEDVVTSVLHSSSLTTSLSEELPHTAPEKPNISDSVLLSIASTADQTEHTSTSGDDQKATEKTSSDLDSSCSRPGSSKLRKALRQLQNQVNRKRATMLVEKLCRKAGTAPQMKHNVTNYKMNMAGQKLRKKVALKKLRRKILTKHLPVSTDAINVSGQSKDALKDDSGNVADKLPRHFNSLPVSDKISHGSSKQNSATQNKEAVCTDTPGVKPVSDSRITPLSNDQNQNINTKSNFVHLQPKVPDIPQEKIQAALHSLHNYLAVTGRKPTTGNTQYILLKVDEQHVLVKWPMTSLPASQQSSTSVPTSQQGSTTVLTFQQSSTTVPTSQQSSSTVASVVKISRGNKRKQNEAKSTAAAAISNNASNSIQSLLGTSALSTVTTNVSSVSNSGLGRGNEFKIIRTHAAKSSDKIIRTHAAKSSDKLSPYNVQVPSAGIQKNVTNVIMENQATGLLNFTDSTFKTGASLNKQTVISLLKSSVPTQSHNKALTTHVSCVSSTSSPVITSVISSPVSDSSSKAGGTDAHISKKTGSDDANITLSRLPPNSLLLPGRKRPNIILSEKERQAKRRRLEEKYPLPPGVVIKSEPDDYQDDLTSLSPDISPAFFANAATMEHSECLEPLIMSSDDQLWSVEDSVNIDPYLTDIGHAVEKHAGGSGVQGLPMNSAADDNQFPHSYMEAENSCDEQDEPPALLDETIDDSDDDIEIEDADAQEDVPPVLQPMFTSSCSSLVKDTDVQELDSTELTPEMPADLRTFVPYNRHVVTARDCGPSSDSTSTTSLYSESSLDSGVDTNSPSTSFSHTSLHASMANRPVSKNLKIQYLKDLLKKKEMEIENMKRVQSELLPSDFDI